MFDIDELIEQCRQAIRESDPRLAVHDVLERVVSRPDEVAAALPATTGRDRAALRRRRPDGAQGRLGAGDADLAAQPPHVGRHRASTAGRRTTPSSAARQAASKPPAVASCARATSPRSGPRRFTPSPTRAGCSPAPSTSTAVTSPAAPVAASGTSTRSTRCPTTSSEPSRSSPTPTPRKRSTRRRCRRPTSASTASMMAAVEFGQRTLLAPLAPRWSRSRSTSRWRPCSAICSRLRRISSACSPNITGATSTSSSRSSTAAGVSTATGGPSAAPSRGGSSSGRRGRRARGGRWRPWSSRRTVVDGWSPLRVSDGVEGDDHAGNRTATAPASHHHRRRRRRRGITIVGAGTTGAGARPARAPRISSADANRAPGPSPSPATPPGRRGRARRGGATGRPAAACRGGRGPWRAAIRRRTVVTRRAPRTTRRLRHRDPSTV